MYSANGLYYTGIGNLTADKMSPELQGGFTAATGVAAGSFHTCAIDSGVVKCWGTNAEGQLGNGTTTNSTAPVTVTGISNAKLIASGYMHTCAILTDSTVRCWGLNTEGQLGNGTTTTSSSPVTVTGISTAVEISASDYGTCAVLADGTTKCWGLNTKGQLGLGALGAAMSSSPTTASGVTNATKIASGADHTCIVTGSGAVQCWGVGTYGQLGTSLAAGYTYTPTTISGISTASRVGAGANHTCAVLSDGTAKCWGLNSNSQLSSSSYFSTNVPTISFVGASLLAMAGGNNHSCTITTDL